MQSLEKIVLAICLACVAALGYQRFQTASSDHSSVSRSEGTAIDLPNYTKANSLAELSVKDQATVQTFDR